MSSWASSSPASAQPSLSPNGPERLLSREEPRVGELIGEQLAKDGITVRTGVTAKIARRDGDDTVVSLDDGSEVRCDVIVAGTGRNPRTNGLGFENAGVELGERGEVLIDEHCCAADGVWALGDVTAVMPFTHVAKYQARVVTDGILGRQRSAHYEGMPRVVFTGPEVAAMGLTSQQARERGIDVATAELDLANSLTRPRRAGRAVPHLHRGVSRRAGTPRRWITRPSLACLTGYLGCSEVRGRRWCL